MGSIEPKWNQNIFTEDYSRNMGDFWHHVEQRSNCTDEKNQDFPKLRQLLKDWQLYLIRENVCESIFQYLWK